MQLKDFSTLKTIPGFNAILRAVLKTQIQALVEQLHDQTGEESLLLTACVSDGTLCFLGSGKGQGFLQGRDDIKSQFLQHCLSVPGAFNQLQVSNQSHVPTAFGGEEIQPGYTSKQNVPQKHHTPAVNDLVQDKSQQISSYNLQQPERHEMNVIQETKALRSSQVLNVPATQQKPVNVPTTTYQTQLIQPINATKGVYVQSNGQQLSVIRPNLDKNELCIQNLGQHFTVLTSPSGSHVLAQPFGNHLTTVPSVNQVITLPRINDLLVTPNSNLVSTSVTHGETVGNNVLIPASQDFVPVPRMSVPQNHGNYSPATVGGNDIIDKNNVTPADSHRHVKDLHNQVQPSTNTTELTTNASKNDKTPTVSVLVNTLNTQSNIVVNQNTLDSQSNIVVSTDAIDNHSGVIVCTDSQSSGFLDSDKSLCENKDKNKKTLSSKIEEITERIKKDDPQKSQDEELTTAEVSPIPEVKSRGGSKSDTPKTRQRKSGKTKSNVDASRASHRKPKLPRYNIGAASDEEEALQEEEISSMDILAIAAGIDDSNSSFHINLDELGDGILKDNEIPLVGLFACNNADEGTNKNVIQNLFNLKPPDTAVPVTASEDVSIKVTTTSHKEGDGTKPPEVKIKTTSDKAVKRGKKRTKEVSLINKKLWLKCSMCPARFPNQDLLKQHTQTVVHRKKKYVCDLCGWKFGQLRDKERHRLTHTGERPYKCDVCNKAFARKDNLKSHVRKHGQRGKIV